MVENILLARKYPTSLSKKEKYAAVLAAVDIRVSKMVSPKYRAPYRVPD